MRTYLRYSKEESEFFKLKIGRSILTDVNIAAFFEEMSTKRYDVVRVRIDKKEERVLASFAEYGCANFIQGGIVKYELPVKGLKHSNFLNPEITMRMYDGSDPESIRKILEQGSAKCPIGYWSTPTLRGLISRESEIRYLHSYFSELYVTSERPLWFIEWEGVPVAFVASDLENGILHTPLAVVLPEWRGRKLLQEIVISRNNYGIAHGATLLSNGARTDNPASQHVFSKFGMKTMGEDHVIHFTPMLSYTKSSLQR